MLNDTSILAQNDDLSFDQTLTTTSTASGGQYVSPEVSADDAIAQLKASSENILFGFRADENKGHRKREAETAVKSARLYINKSRDRAWAWWCVFEAVYGEQVEVNEWTGKSRLRSNRDFEYTTVQLVTKLTRILDCSFSGGTSDRMEWFDDFTKDRSFNPVAEYFAGLVRADLGLRTPLYGRAEHYLLGLRPEAWEPSEEDKAFFSEISSFLFGTDDSFSQTKVAKWLIGAVARAINPGCKNDCALVVLGKQNIGKTSGLKELFNGLFKTLHAHQKTENQVRISQHAWCLELGEIEATFRAKDISALKAFMTETTDDLVKKYKEDVDEFPRHWVFAGTTNQTAFLNDPTGSRRFWVIDARGRDIPVAAITDNSDRIWRVALWHYLSKTRWWMDSAENELNEACNKAYAADSPVEDRLEALLGRVPVPSGFDYWALTPDTARIFSGLSTSSPTSTKAVAAAMESMGYTKGRYDIETLEGPQRMRAYRPLNAKGKGHELTEDILEALTMKQATQSRAIANAL